MILACIWQVPGSNVGEGTGGHDRFPLIYPGKWQDGTITASIHIHSSLLLTLTQ